jgi:uncharacterized protein
MAASKTQLERHSSKRDRIPRRAALLDKRLEALCAFCDPMMLSELDGFLAGIAVCLEPVSLDEWLPAVLNLEPDEKVEAVLGPDETTAITGLLLERFDEISNEIAAKIYFPIIDVDAQSGDVLWYLWVSGLDEAMEFRPGSWDIFAVGSNISRNALKGLRRLIALNQGGGELPDDGFGVIVKLAPTLVPVWLESLMDWRLSGGTSAYPEPLRLKPAAAGRNDPCPCGSGKKYKKCCYAQ